MWIIGAPLLVAIIDFIRTPKVTTAHRGGIGTHGAT